MRARIAWLVPHPIKGSGGHRTIFSHVRNLVERGHECHVFIGEEHNHRIDAKSLKGIVSEFFGGCTAELYSGYSVPGSFDVAIATAWWTAEIVSKEVDAKKKIYFVQDYEPWFNPMGDNFIKAENSYRQGLQPITIGRWLTSVLRDKYESEACFFEFTADKNIYRPLASRMKTENKNLCFIYQPEKPRRCPQIGREALAIVKYHCPDSVIYTYGSSELPNFNFEHTHLGILSVEECNRLYNDCAVGLCFSSSNPSRVPFEMMAAGLPVVDFYGENTIHDMPQEGVILAERNPSAVAGALISILNSTDKQRRMRNAGLTFMLNRHSELEFEQFASQLEAFIIGEPVAAGDILPMYQKTPYTSKLSIPLTTNQKNQNLREKNEREMSILERLRNNRIGRVLKVMWRGYY